MAQSTCVRLSCLCPIPVANSCFSLKQRHVCIDCISGSTIARLMIRTSSIVNVVSVTCGIPLFICFLFSSSENVSLAVYPFGVTYSIRQHDGEFRSVRRSVPVQRGPGRCWIATS